MTANGPLMYKVCPLYDFYSDISLPTCMYKMNNIHDNSPLDSNEINLNNLDLAELEKSQLSILQKLEDLQAKVIQLKEDLGVVSENNLGAFQDIVIKANPQYPPLSVWVFYQLLSKSCPTQLVTYLHSSLTKVPEGVRQLKNIPSSQPCQISLTVIWRDGKNDHEMMIDPVHQGIIEGEVNIGRYISRLLSFNYDADAVLSTQIDNWLEVAHSSIIHGNNKDRQGALRSLNSHLGKSTFLVGDRYSLADIILWSALVQTKLHQSLPNNVTKWYKSLLNMDVFRKCDELVLS